MKDLIQRHDANLQQFLTAQGYGPLGSVEYLPGCRRVLNGLPGGGRILAADLEPSALAAFAQEQLRWFGTKGEAWQWVLCPGDKPADIRCGLELAGLAELSRFPVLALDLAQWVDGDSALPPPLSQSLLLEHVGSAQQLEQWIDVASCAYPFGAAARPAARSMLSALSSRDGLDLWLLMDGDIPVTTAASCRTGDDVGMYWAATPPEYRGRGYATALVRLMVVWAQAAGSGMVFTQNSPASRGICLRGGFRETGWIYIFGP